MDSPELISTITRLPFGAGWPQGDDDVRYLESCAPAGAVELLYMGQPVKLDYLWAGMCLLGAVFFMFRAG